jgi:hypothetical protein
MQLGLPLIITQRWPTIQRTFEQSRMGRVQTGLPLMITHREPGAGQEVGVQRSRVMGKQAPARPSASRAQSVLLRQMVFKQMSSWRSASSTGLASAFKAKSAAVSRTEIEGAILDITWDVF